MKNLALFTLLIGVFFLFTGVATTEVDECRCTVYNVDISKDFQFGLTAFFSRNVSVGFNCQLTDTQWAVYDMNGNAVPLSAAVGGFMRATFPSAGTYDICVTHTVTGDPAFGDACSITDTYCESFVI